jgi:hypothetical protein
VTGNGDEALSTFTASLNKYSDDATRSTENRTKTTNIKLRFRKKKLREFYVRNDIYSFKITWIVAYK